MSPRMKLLLIVSLALNLFAIGSAAGALIMGVHLGGRPPIPFSNTSMRAPPLLQPEKGAALRVKLRAAAEAGAADRRASRQARREAAELMARDPYDAPAVAAAFARSRASDTAARARIEAALVEGLQVIDAPDRATIGAQMLRGRGRRGGGRPDGPPPPEPPPQP